MLTVPVSSSTTGRWRISLATILDMHACMVSLLKATTKFAPMVAISLTVVLWLAFPKRAT